MGEQPVNTGNGDAMTENSRSVAVIKGQLSKFSGIISKDLPKPTQRLVREMLYGIQASKDIKLSCITRSLNEPIPPIKTEDRLSRNLDDRDFTEPINNQVCRLGSRNVLAIDPGDIRKRYASRMECLCKIHDGSEHEIGDGYWLVKAVAAVIIKYEDGKEEKTTVSFNVLPVRLPGYDYPLFLVVVKGFGKLPMMLLTSCPVNTKMKESIWRIVEIYLTRWKCDESFRYSKQCYNLEDRRVRSYLSIRNIVVLVLAVACFAAVYLGDNLKLKMLVQRIYLVSKRFFGVPTFFNYAIADGLYTLLFPDRTGIKETPRTKKPEFQPSFSFWEECG
jgi:hypothetical protein